MDEKDYEIQKLRRELNDTKSLLGTYQEALKWTRDKLNEVERDFFEYKNGENHG